MRRAWYKRLAEIEVELPFWASFREYLATEVPSFNPKHLVETKKAKNEMAYMRHIINL